MIRNVRKAVIVGAAGIGLAASALAQSAMSTGETGAPAQDGSAAVAPIAADQQASKEQLAKLFEVMRVRQQMESMTKMMPALIEQQMKTQMDAMKAKMPNGKQMPAEEQAAIEKLMSREIDRAMHLVSFDDMVADLTEVYQRHISKTDADAFIAFYSSTAGQHLLDEQPAIMKEYMPRVMAHVREKTRELTDEMMKDMAELTKQYEQPVKPAAAKQ
jgi:hypothetical protein